MKKIIYFSLGAIMFFNFSAEAQIFKKLKKKVEEKVEKTVTNNVSDKAADETDKSLNKMWEKNPDKAKKNTSATSMIGAGDIPNTYHFDWKYTMDIKTNEGNNKIVYHIKKDAPYVGMRVPGAQDMITVMDNKNNLNVMFINSGGTKYVTGTKMEDVTENDSGTYKNMEIEKIGSKNILGYHSQGYRSENEDHVFIFYVTDKAGISFTDMFQKDQTDLPDGFNPEWLENGKGLLMEMQMKDKKNQNKNITMTCTGIKKKDFTIHTSDYQNMGGR